MNALLVKAANFAAIKHQYQRRKGNKDLPYIGHPLGVAHILSSEAEIDDVEVLVAAFLHDTVEDTDATHEELEKEFGQRIAEIVAEVTDDKSKTKVERKRLQVLHAPHRSTQAKLVKLADKLHNLRDLVVAPPSNWSILRAYGYFVWASFVVDGLRGTNSKMEAELDKLFESQKVPKDQAEREEALQAYYDLLQGDKQ